MSYSIYQNSRLVFEYQASAISPSIKFYDRTLENDVLEGLAIPYYLRAQFNGRTIIPYPPEGEDINAFAEIYRRTVFENELVKHHFTLREEHAPFAHLQKKA